MSDSYSALFVSPHFDDVALSCGGTVAREAGLGRALIVTIFAGEPGGALSEFAAFQHRRWGVAEAVPARRREDLRACSLLGADHCWLDYRDAIYRGEQYRSDDDLFGEVKPGDASVAAAVKAELLTLVTQLRPARVYLPLGIGGHVDHHIATAAGPAIAPTGTIVRYYEDFPYVVAPGAIERRFATLGWSLTPETVDITSTIEQKLAAIAAYPSQLPTILRDYGERDEVVRAVGRARAGAAEGYAERFWGE